LTKGLSSSEHPPLEYPSHDGNVSIDKARRNQSKGFVPSRSISLMSQAIAIQTHSIVRLTDQRRPRRRQYEPDFDTHSEEAAVGRNTFMTNDGCKLGYSGDESHTRWPRMKYAIRPRDVNKGIVMAPEAVCNMPRAVKGGRERAFSQLKTAATTVQRVRRGSLEEVVWNSVSSSPD
jgi:hypothetical protein